jgi:hypothetical protein
MKTAMTIEIFIVSFFIIIMQYRKKLNISDLFITGTASPYKSPSSKVSSIDLGNRKVSATPDSKKSYTNYSLKSKWYMKGHKFTTIYQAKAPKPAPKLSLAGTTHTSFNGSQLRPALLLQQKIFSRMRNQNSLLMTKKQPPKSASLQRRSSSKNLQVDFHELESWIT